MSLAQLAQHLQSQGRGNDKLLVHMTPNEVGGLQSLAMAHGGSLTINPQTGLPEAGFLEKILPTIIGAGVGIATMNPMLGAAAGGVSGMAMNDGSLQAGLMAGLSSYGLGSLGVGIAGAGAASLGTAAGAASAASTPGIATSFAPEAMGFVGEGALAAGAGTTPMGLAGAADAGLAGIGANVTPPLSTWDSLRAGFGAVSEQPGGWGQFMKSNMVPAGMAGAGLLGAMNAGDNTQNQAPDSTGYIRPFDMETTVNPSAYTPGTPYMTRTLTPQEPVPADEWGSQSFANGGIAQLAEGGDLEKYKAYNTGYNPSSVYVPPTNTDIVNYYGTTASTPLLEGDIAANQATVAATPEYLLPQNNPSNIFGTAYNPYIPMGFQSFGQNRYGPPTAQTNMPVVDQYNEELAKQANLEYMGQPMLAPFISKQRKELERAYDEVLEREPDAPSQKVYLEQMDQGKTIEQVKEDMKKNPPPVPKVNPIKDTTPTQNPYPTTLKKVETPYGKPAAVEKSAVVNKEAVKKAADAQAVKVAQQEITKRLAANAKDKAAADAKAKLAAQAKAAADAKAKADAAAKAKAAADAKAKADAAAKAAAAKAKADAAAKAKAAADAKAKADADKKWREEQRKRDLADKKKREDEERARAAKAKADADAAAKAKADAAAKAKSDAEARAKQEAQITQTLGYNPRASTDGSTYAGAFTLPEDPEESLDQYYMRTLGYNPLSQSGGGAAAGGLMKSYAAGGGIGSLPRYNLGGYSDGGRLLKGPGDGVSDNIPAVIGDKQPARLADGEFVIPARIVSEIGNGSTDAGAKRLYAMMERIQKARKKSVGKGKVAVDSKAYKHLPK